MSTEQYIIEGSLQGNRVRGNGQDPMWTDDSLFQPIQGGHNMVMKLDWKGQVHGDSIYRVQNQILSKHDMNRLDAHKMEHRQVYLPPWLTPYIKLVESHWAARSVFEPDNHRDESMAMSISPVYDMYANQIQMFLFFQGAVLHNWNRWLDHSFKGSTYEQDKVRPDRSPLAHYGQIIGGSTTTGGISIIDTIEKEGWKHVQNGEFDFDSPSGGGVPDRLWWWGKRSHNNPGEDWQSTEANPNKHHVKPSDMETDLYGMHTKDGPALIFGQPVKNDNERHENINIGGHGYNKEVYAIYGGTFHQSMPAGRQWANRFEQYEYTRLGLK